MGKEIDEKREDFCTDRRGFLKGLTIAPTAAYFGRMAMSMGTLGTAGAIGGLTSMASCSRPKSPGSVDVGANPDLREHTKEFNREVIEVTDGVHVAVGFGLANSILIEGDDGVVIVDTMESLEAAVPVREAFSGITEKPIRAIIYTHYHPDHTFGADVFYMDDKPDVYSHATTPYYLDRLINVVRSIIYKRSTRQFGTMLSGESFINAGIGPELLFRAENTIGLIRPNVTFNGEMMEVDIAGIKLVLVHAPGETPDQIFVWLPEKGVLLPGDNYYKSFPNLYAIRGTPYRDVTDWVRSLDKMRRLMPEHLVLGHSRPLTGKDLIYENLTNYRDAIQFVHDQTIRGINEGLTPDRLVERVKLPPHLANLPYLQEYYGTVEWSVRAIFEGYLGWFGGNATDLFPLPPKERAEKISRLAGGKDVILKKAREAMENGDYQWVLELSDILLALDPNDAEAKEIKAGGLTALGERQVAATARNYYLTQALEIQGKIEIGEREVKEIKMVHDVPLAAIFDSMAVSLNPEKSSDTDKVVGFRFPDVKEDFTLHVRRGVCEVQPVAPKSPDVTVTVNSTVWKEIGAGMRNPAAALAKGDVKVEGGTLNIVKFLSLFDRSD